jgi:hypothetical protein
VEERKKIGHRRGLGHGHGHGHGLGLGLGNYNGNLGPSTVLPLTLS